MPACFREPDLGMVLRAGRGGIHISFEPRASNPTIDARTGL